MRRSIAAMALAVLVLWTALVCRNYLPHGISPSLLDVSALWRGPFPLAVRAWYLDAILAAVLGFAALCNGAWILDRFHFEMDNAERVVLGTALGFAILALAASTLGAMHLFRPLPLRALMALFTLASFIRWPRELRTLAALAPLALSAPFLLMALAAAAVPETAYDALGWHLPAARSFLQSGTFSFLEMYRTNIPHYGTVLYALGLAMDPGNDFRGESVARMLTFLLLPGIGLATVAMVRRIGVVAPFAAALAALWVVSCPDVMAQAVTCCPDLGAALWAVVAVLAALAGSPLLAGLFAGMAAGTKFVGLYAIPMAGVVLLVLRKNWRALLLFGAVSVTVCAPWYVRNYLFTGDPVHPMLQKYLAHPRLDPQTIEAMTTDHVNRLRVPVTLGNYLAMPWLLTMDGNVFFGALGAAFLWTFPFIVWGARRDRAWLALAAALPLFSGLWLVGPQWTRYFIPGLPMVAALGVAGIYHERVTRVVRLAACGIGVILTLLNLPGMNRTWSGGANDVLVEIPWRAAFGDESEARYRHTHIPSYDAAQFLNSQNLPADATVRPIPTFHFFPPWLTRFTVLSFWDSRPAAVVAMRRNEQPLPWIGAAEHAPFHLIAYVEGTFLYGRDGPHPGRLMTVTDLTPASGLLPARPLQGDERVAIPIPPGSSLERRIYLDGRYQHSELSFALGQHAGDVIGGAMTDLSVFAAGRMVFTHRFGPDEAERNWQQFHVPLAGFAGDSVPIVFRSSTVEGRTSSRLFIADPVVYESF